MSDRAKSSPTATQLESLERAWSTVQQTLREQQHACGHWTGQLSASSLSTATAVSALAQMCKSGSVPQAPVPQAPVPQAPFPQAPFPQARDELVATAISEGCQWLCHQQNDDGGFGDTDRSHSNIATSLLVLAAWELALSIKSDASNDPLTAELRSAIALRQTAAWKYVELQGKWEGLRKRYGRDKTFVVPILSNCALAGLVDWREVAPLPFEAAWLPQELYRWARLPVVSYAVPALVAIGQARFHFAPPANPLMRTLRRRAQAPTLKVLRSMQPASGGYLEATPLTSFVLMNLAAMGQGHLPVARDCLRFLLDARLADGSWPIDTNLATWVTSLTIRGLGQRRPNTIDCRSAPPSRVPSSRVSNRLQLSGDVQPLVTARTIRWLLACQHRRRHPFTGANPGGWGWTDLSGAVPDADDTPAALLALHSIDWSPAELQRLEQQALDAVGWGLKWLLRLQNRDGGWPTFCRGWGTLPFDRSGTDLTAHAIRALHVWAPHLERIAQQSNSNALRRKFLSQKSLSPKSIRTAVERGFTYLERNQRSDGSWLPLWFGNQDRPDEDNPVYGTGKVLLAYGLLERLDARAAQLGRDYLIHNQNGDGGWGGGPSQAYDFNCRDTALAGTGTHSGSTIEETAVAVEGLMCGGQRAGDSSIMQALDWLVQAIQSGRLECASPIGFYFAKLWYHERLYPTVFSLGALGAALARFECDDLKMSSPSLISSALDIATQSTVCDP